MPSEFPASGLLPLVAVKLSCAAGQAQAQCLFAGPLMRSDKTDLNIQSCAGKRVPSWSKNQPGAARLINARSEIVGEEPSRRRVFNQKLHFITQLMLRMADGVRPDDEQ